MKPTQRFSPEYLAQCRKATPEQILTWLEEFRRLRAESAGANNTSPEASSRPSKLISLRVPEPLLAAFRARCEIEGVKYQTQIKRLMRAWADAASNESAPD